MPCERGAHAKWDWSVLGTGPMVPRVDTEPTGIPWDDAGGNVHLARRVACVKSWGSTGKGADGHQLPRLDRVVFNGDARRWLGHDIGCVQGWWWCVNGWIGLSVVVVVLYGRQRGGYK